MTRRANLSAIAITVGDPSGIGPEIVAKTIAQCAPPLRNRLRVICHESWFADLAASLRCDTSGVSFEDLSATIHIDDPGAAQVAYLERAVTLVNEDAVSALVTAPIHKGRAKAAGFEFPGHTEFLAARLGAQRVAMMFDGPSMRVVLATIHVPLARVTDALTPVALETAIDLGLEALAKNYALAKPRIAVLGLNPHSGEGGILGDEEIDVIIPAIEAARMRHPAAEFCGPLVPDAAYRTKADLFVAMYHDQALIPLKILDFDRAVNVTLGLPIVRTSPDHGTADDIAGKGIARPDSMLAALELAAKMVD